MKNGATLDPDGEALFAVEQTTGTNVGPLYAADQIVQSFDVANDHLTGLRLLIGTYGRRPQTSVRLTVHDGAQCLRESVVDARSFDDNQWQHFPFPPLEMRGRRLTMSIRNEGTREDQAIALWLAVPGSPSALRNGAPVGGALCFSPWFSHATDEVLDRILFEPEAIPPIVQPEAIHDFLRLCLYSADISFLRLVHLADGIRRARREIGNLRRMLSIGAGMGHHESFLAARMPDVDIVASDLERGLETHSLPNLRWDCRDITAWNDDADYDLVFSIECLEHIADPVRAFRNMSRKVRPGGCLYLSVPFATAEEQADGVLCKHEWEAHEHHRPGFSFGDLEHLFTENGLRIVHAGSMFRGALGAYLHALLRGMSTPAREAVFGDAARLLFHDLEGPRATCRNEATGIRALGRRKE